MGSEMCIRDRSQDAQTQTGDMEDGPARAAGEARETQAPDAPGTPCLLYTSDAADERSSVDLGGRRIL